MSTLFFRQPRLVLLSVLVIVSAGLSAFLSIGRQEDPTITNLFATVTTFYPGAEPTRVESLVTEKIERELREIASIATVESTSSSGVSVINLELQETLDDAAIEVAWADVRAALDDARLTLPPEVPDPDFASDATGTFASIVALKPAAGTSVAVAQRYAESLADRLRRLSGTDSVELFGSVEEEVLVEIDGTLLSALGIGVEQIARTIESADTKVRAGRVRAASSQMVIELSANVSSLGQIRDIPLVVAGDAVTRLGDVATVSRGHRRPVDELALSSGEPALLVAARVGDGLQIDVWMHDVRGVLDEFEGMLPAGVTLERLFDQSAYTRERLAGVAFNMALGMALVILVLFITLGVRAALIVATVLPLVTLASIATMNALGMAIQQMSLTGLIVALGLLVDAAIVMTDEIRQRLQGGLSRLAAVDLSVRRLFAPLLASTVTTALSFMPMALLPGPSGDFVGSIALAVIIMLGWSFLVAVTVTAAMAGWTLPARRGASAFADGLSLGGASRLFERSLRASLLHPWRSIALALVLPLAGFVGAAGLTAQFFPGVDRDQLHIEVELAAGTPIEETRRTALAVDRLLGEFEDVTRVAWVIGRSAPSFYYNMVGDRRGVPEFAQALVTTASAAATARLVPELQARLDEEITGARVLVRDLVQGPPVDAPVEIRLLGPDLDVLRAEGDRLRALMSTVESVTAVRTSLEGGAPKVVLDVDEEAARTAGLSLASVARQLEATLEGQTGGSLLEGTEQLPIRVRADDAFRGNLAAIANLPLVPDSMPSGGAPTDGVSPTVPLAAIADVAIVPAQSAIGRRDGERVNTVQAFVRYGVLPEEALGRVQAAMRDAGFEPPPGYRLQTGGDSDARDTTLNSLLASLGIIVTLSVATVVITFDSFRLAAVTFAVAGLSAGLSMLSLALLDYPLGINSIIGIVGSIGVSVNAAIIILSGLQEDEGALAGSVEDAVAVVMGSSRHIVSTTVTTFGGFLPLILAGGGFWPPFATAIAGGVLLSAVVSFYFTPPMFRLVQARRWRSERESEGKGPLDARGGGAPPAAAT